MLCVVFLAVKENHTVLFFSQVLLRVKENEIEYLHKEISCLRNELQVLNMVLCVDLLPKYVRFFI